MAEKTLLIDPQTITIAELAEMYSGKKNVTRFKSSLKNLGSMTLEEFITPDPETGVAPYYAHYEKLVEEAKSKMSSNSIRTYMQDVRYTLGATARYKLDSEDPILKKLPGKDSGDVATLKFWKGNEEPPKGVSQVSISSDRRAVKAFYDAIEEFRATPEGKAYEAVIDAIIVNERTGLRPSTISGLKVKEFITDQNTLGIVPETVSFVDKDTGEVIDDFSIPENAAKREKAIKEIQMRTGVSKGAQEFGRTAAIALNVALDDDALAAIQRREAANRNIPSYAKMLETPESMLLNQDKLFIFVKPDGSQVTNQDMIDVLRKIRVTYEVLDPVTRTFVKQGILVDNATGISFDTIAPTAAEVKAAGEKAGIPNYSIKSGIQNMRSWHVSKLIDAGYTVDDIMVVQGRKNPLQKMGYGHTTKGQVGRRFKVLAKLFGDYLNTLAGRHTGDYDQTMDRITEGIRTGVDQEYAPVIQLHANPPDYVQQAANEAADVQTSFALNEQYRKHGLQSSKEISIFQDKQENIIAPLRKQFNEVGKTFTDDQLWSIANDLGSGTRFESFWHMKDSPNLPSYGERILELGDKATIADINTLYQRFLKLTSINTRGGHMAKSAGVKPYKPVPANVRRELTNLRLDASDILKANDPAESILNFTSHGIHEAAKRDSDFADRLNTFIQEHDELAEDNPKLKKGNELIEDYYYEVRDLKEKNLLRKGKKENLLLLKQMLQERFNVPWNKVFMGIGAGTVALLASPHAMAAEISMTSFPASGRLEAEENLGGQPGPSTLFQSMSHKPVTEMSQEELLNTIATGYKTEAGEPAERLVVPHMRERIAYKENAIAGIDELLANPNLSNKARKRIEAHKKKVVPKYEAEIDSIRRGLDQAFVERDLSELGQPEKYGAGDPVSKREGVYPTVTTPISEQYKEQQGFLLRPSQ